MKEYIKIVRSTITFVNMTMHQLELLSADQYCKDLCASLAHIDSELNTLWIDAVNMNDQEPAVTVAMIDRYNGILKGMKVLLSQLQPVLGYDAQQQAEGLNSFGQYPISKVKYYTMYVRESAVMTGKAFVKIVSNLVGKVVGAGKTVLEALTSAKAKISEASTSAKVKGSEVLISAKDIASETLSSAKAKVSTAFHSVYTSISVPVIAKLYPSKSADITPNTVVVVPNTPASDLESDVVSHSESLKV